MSELRDLIAAASALRASRTPFISATVVSVQGSAYRRPGARMLATEGTWQAGSISAGCLERDVLGKGFWRTQSGSAVRVRYAEAEDALEEARGSGCQGVIDYLLERWDPAQSTAADPWLCLERCWRDEAPGVLVTVSRAPGAALGTHAWLSAGKFETSATDPELSAALRAAAAAALHTGPATRVTQLAAAGPHPEHLELLVERILPPPHLFIFGSGHDVDPVLRLAKQLGWTVSVWDGQPRFSARERLRAADHYLGGPLTDAVRQLQRAAQPLAMVMGHDLAQDQEVLAALLTCRLLYLGVLGPQRRTQQMLQRLTAAGVRSAESTLAKLRGPAGISLGAQTPAEIALSIVAQMQEALHLAATSGEASP